MLHVDDDERIETWRRWVGKETPPTVAPADTREGRLQLMLFAALGHRRRPIAELSDALAELWAAAPVRRELCELLELLGDRIRARARALSPGEAMPLASHATYGLFEIMAAFAVTGGKGSLVQLQTGVYWAKQAATDLLFITLEKADAEYSPTTRYEDYPLSPTHFHWESQNVTASSSPTGRRYVEHQARGSKVILFVRERKKDGRGMTSPYLCLGYGRYVRHESERPMRIVWELERSMPAWLYQAGKVAAG